MCLDAMYPSCIGLGHNSSNSCLVRARNFIINQKMEKDGKCHVHVIHHIRIGCFVVFYPFPNPGGMPIPSHPHGSLAPKLRRRRCPPLSQFLHPVSNGLHTVLDVLIAQGLAVHPQIHAHHVVLRRILWKGQLFGGTQSQQNLLVWLVLNVGNGWEWGNGMIIDNYCGSFPKIPC